MNRNDALDFMECLVISGIPVNPEVTEQLITAVGPLNPTEARRIDSAMAFRDLVEEHTRLQLEAEAKLACRVQRAQGKWSEILQGVFDKVGTQIVEVKNDIHRPTR